MPSTPTAIVNLSWSRAKTRLRIIVPGKTHILSAEIGRVNAPRILRDIKGDFDVSVRVAGTSHPAGKATTTVYPPYHGAGLLIWQDQENYVRLEIAADLQHGKARPYVNFEYRKDGALAASSGIKNTDGSNHLRLKRRGAEIYASFGPDGVRWTSFSPLTAKLKDRLNVGVAAINSSTKPLTAEFEGFDVLEREEPINTSPMRLEHKEQPDRAPPDLSAIWTGPWMRHLQNDPDQGASLMHQRMRILGLVI